MTRALLVIVALVVMGGPVWAQPAVAGLAYTPPAPPAAPDPLGLVIRLVVMTAGLVALCLGVVYVNRRVNRPASATDPTGRIVSEGSLTLDRGCAVHILRIDGQSVAVTTDATGVRSIVLLSEPFDAALASAEQASPPDNRHNRAA